VVVTPREIARVDAKRLIHPVSVFDSFSATKQLAGPQRASSVVGRGMCATLVMSMGRSERSEVMCRQKNDGPRAEVSDVVPW